MLAINGFDILGSGTSTSGITASSIILDENGKIPNQYINYSGSSFQGVWNANLNIPQITSGQGTSGNYYIVQVAGNTLVDGKSNWGIGDYIIFDGTIWQKVDNPDTVLSVAGKIGAVVLSSNDITDFQASVSVNTDVVNNKNNIATLQIEQTTQNTNITTLQNKTQKLDTSGNITDFQANVSVNTDVVNNKNNITTLQIEQTTQNTNITTLQNKTQKLDTSGNITASITTPITSFTQDQEIITKKYVDDIFNSSTAMNFQGLYDPLTPSPNLTDPSLKVKGHYYVVGSQGIGTPLVNDLNGDLDQLGNIIQLPFFEGDHIIYNGTKWDYIRGYKIMDSLRQTIIIDLQHITADNTKTTISSPLELPLLLGTNNAMINLDITGKIQKTNGLVDLAGNITVPKVNSNDIETTNIKNQDTTPIDAINIGTGATANITLKGTTYADTNDNRIPIIDGTGLITKSGAVCTPNGSIECKNITTHEVKGQVSNQNLKLSGFNGKGIEIDPTNDNICFTGGSYAGGGPNSKAGKLLQIDDAKGTIIPIDPSPANVVSSSSTNIVNEIPIFDNTDGKNITNSTLTFDNTTKELNGIERISFVDNQFIAIGGKIRDELKQGQSITRYPNIAIGYRSGGGNIVGTLNEGVEGISNVYLGFEAGKNHTKGKSNIFIGNTTAALDPNVEYEFSSAIGSFTVIERNNEMVLGRLIGDFNTDEYCIRHGIDNVCNLGYYDAGNATNNRQFKNLYLTGDVFKNGVNYLSNVVQGTTTSNLNEIPRYVDTSGKQVKNSGITINDLNDMSNVNDINFTGNLYQNGNLFTGGGGGGSINGIVSTENPASSGQYDITFNSTQYKTAGYLKVDANGLISVEQKTPTTNLEWDSIVNYWIQQSGISGASVSAILLKNQVQAGSWTQNDTVYIRYSLNGNDNLVDITSWSPFNQNTITQANIRDAIRIYPVEPNYTSQADLIITRMLQEFSWFVAPITSVDEIWLGDPTNWNESLRFHAKWRYGNNVIRNSENGFLGSSNGFYYSGELGSIPPGLVRIYP